MVFSTTLIHPAGKESNLARNNYSYAKRQRELAKKKKKEEKRLKKLEKKNRQSEDPAGTNVETAK